MTGYQTQRDLRKSRSAPLLSILRSTLEADCRAFSSVFGVQFGARLDEREFVCNFPMLALARRLSMLCHVSEELEKG